MAIEFIMLNIALGFTSFLFTVRLLHYRVSDRLRFSLAWFTIFISLIIFLEIVIGIFGILSWKYVSIFGYTLFLYSLLALGKTTWNRLSFKAPQNQKFPNPLLTIMVYAPALLFLIIRTFGALLQIPLEYDALVYRLPMVVEWLKTSSLLQIYYNAFAGPLSYYPSNYELLNLWTFLPLRNDFLINPLNSSLFIVLSITLFALLRKLNINSRMALITAAIPLYLPIFIRQAGVPLADLFFSLTFALSLYFLCEIIAYQNTTESLFSSFLLFGLNLGLFAGTKYLGIIYGIFLFGFFFCILLISKHFHKWSGFFLTLFGIFITGSFFYIRNWIHSRNPLFPLDFSIGGIHFQGYEGAGMENIFQTSLIAHMFELQTWKEFFQRYFDLTGPIGFLIFALPIANITHVLFSNRAKKTSFFSDQFLHIFFLATFFLYFFLYIKAPYTFRDMSPNIRYMMPFLIIGILNIGFIFSRFRWTQFLWYIIGATSFFYAFFFLILKPLEAIDRDRLSLNFQLTNNYPLFFFISMAAMIVTLFFVYYIFIKSKKYSVFVGLLIVLIFLWTPIISFSYHARETLRPQTEYSWLSKAPTLFNIIQASEWLNTYDPNANIAYSGFSYHYSLFGRDLSREVDYVNINKCLDCRYREYKNSKESIRRDPDYQHWFANLRAKKKEYLVIDPVSMPQVRSYEFEWALEHPETFQKVFEQETIYIFKISYATKTYSSL